MSNATNLAKARMHRKVERRMAEEWAKPISVVCDEVDELTRRLEHEQHDLSDRRDFEPRLELAEEPTPARSRRVWLPTRWTGSTSFSVPLTMRRK